MSNRSANPSPSMHYFTVRLWSEPITDDEQEWRGSLRSPIVGFEQHFASLDVLFTLIKELVENSHEPTDNLDSQ